MTNTTRSGFSEEALKGLEALEERIALERDASGIAGPEGGPPATWDTGAAGERPRPHYWGHRERLRTRFAESGPDALPDYEIVEMILFNAVPRIDVKPLAKALLDEFGGFEPLVTASRERLAQSPRTDAKIIHQLKLAEAVARRLARSRMTARPVMDGWDAVIAYCRTVMGHREIEHFRVLYLDVKNGVIADEELGRGTVNHVPAYPREIVKRALERSASGVILIHNHPTGDPTPSEGDLAMTDQIRSALATVDIRLIDHIIVGKGRELSFRASGLLG